MANPSSATGKGNERAVVLLRTLRNNGIGGIVGIGIGGGVVGADSADEELARLVERLTSRAYFNDSQRQATKDAGTISGVNVNVLSTNQQLLQLLMVWTRRRKEKRIF